MGHLNRCYSTTRPHGAPPTPDRHPFDTAVTEHTDGLVPWCAPAGIAVLPRDTVSPVIRGHHHICHVGSPVTGSFSVTNTSPRRSDPTANSPTTTTSHPTPTHHRVGVHRCSRHHPNTSERSSVNDAGRTRREIPALRPWFSPQRVYVTVSPESPSDHISRLQHRKTWRTGVFGHTIQQGLHNYTRISRNHPRSDTNSRITVAGSIFSPVTD